MSAFEQLTLQRFALTPDQVRLLTSDWLPAPAPRPIAPSLTREYHAAHSNRSYHRRAWLQIAGAQAGCEITDSRLMRICLEVAVARGIPVQAILSRRRFRTLVAAREEVWLRANVELRLNQTAIARQFGYSPSSVSWGLSAVATERKAA
ncbi:MAG TPA: hypothetical protein VNT99_08380 [Methylomirabilota bacterium]|nr:hypothetical protein [Methylomirabilota bacterium]